VSTESSFERVGRDAAQSTLVSLALAIACHDQDNPRETLKNFLSTFEERIGQKIREASTGLSDNDRAVGADAFQREVLDVARLADVMLAAMGSPPAA